MVNSKSKSSDSTSIKVAKDQVITCGKKIDQSCKDFTGRISAMAEEMRHSIAVRNTLKVVIPLLVCLFGIILIFSKVYLWGILILITGIIATVLLVKSIGDPNDIGEAVFKEVEQLNRLDHELWYGISHLNDD